jgi:hypothetical protein
LYNSPFIIGIFVIISNIMYSCPAIGKFKFVFFMKLLEWLFNNENSVLYAELMIGQNKACKDVLFCI